MAESYRTPSVSRQGKALVVDQAEPDSAPAGPAPSSDASFGTILSDLFDSTQALVHKEVDLVKAEVQEKVEGIKTEAQEKGKGVALLAGAGVFALVGLFLLGMTLLLGLQAWFGLSAWLAAALVTLLYFVIAGILAWIGKGILAPDTPDPVDAPTHS